MIYEKIFIVNDDGLADIRPKIHKNYISPNGINYFMKIQNIKSQK